MAADGQISLCSICPTRHPGWGIPRLACAMAGFFIKSNNNGAMELTRLPYIVWCSCQRNRIFARKSVAAIIVVGFEIDGNRDDKNFYLLFRKLFKYLKPYPNIMKRAIFILLVLLLLVSGCEDNEDEKMRDYQKCTTICSSVLSEDFVTLELCRQECKEKFLEEEK